jgi:hypothetical protein
MINLVTVLNKLTISECSQIWHIANKFQKHSINFHIAFEQNPDQHHLTSLIYKLDWEKLHHNPNLNFQIYFPKQIFDVCQTTGDLKWALIEEYLKEKLSIDYIVYVHPDILFSQQPTPAMWVNIDQTTNWHGGGSLIYGKSLQKDQDWIHLEEYPLIDLSSDLNSYKRASWPPIGIFDEKLKTSSEYKSWREFIQNKYLNGDNLFTWENSQEGQS